LPTFAGASLPLRADVESVSPPRGESPPPPAPRSRQAGRPASGGGALRRSKTRHCVSENRLDAAGLRPPEGGSESVSAVRYGGPALGAVPATPPAPAVGGSPVVGCVSPSCISAQPPGPQPGGQAQLATRPEAAAAAAPRREAPGRAAGASVGSRGSRPAERHAGSDSRATSATAPAERSRFAPKPAACDAGDSPRSPLPAAPHPGGALALVDRAAAASLAASFHARNAAARAGGASSSCSSLASTDCSDAADTSPPHSLNAGGAVAAALLARPSLAGGVLRPRARSSSSGSLAGSTSRLSALGGADGRDSSAALLPPPRPPLASPSPPPYDAPPPPPRYEAPPWLPAEPSALLAAAEARRHALRSDEPSTPKRRATSSDAEAPPGSPTSPYAALGYLVTPGGRRAEPSTPAAARYAGQPLPFPLRRPRASRLCSVLPGACPVVRPALEDAAASAETSAAAYVAGLLGSLATAALALVTDAPQLPPTPPELERSNMARRVAERAEGAAAAY
jgi:hypothetical protein